MGLVLDYAKMGHVLLVVHVVIYDYHPFSCINILSIVLIPVFYPTGQSYKIDS